MKYTVEEILDVLHSNFPNKEIDYISYYDKKYFFRIVPDEELKGTTFARYFDEEENKCKTFDMFKDVDYTLLVDEKANRLL